MVFVRAPQARISARVLVCVQTNAHADRKLPIDLIIAQICKARQLFSSYFLARQFCVCIKRAPRPFFFINLFSFVCFIFATLFLLLLCTRVRALKI